MDPRSQLIVIEDKIAKLDIEERLLDGRRRDFFEKMIELNNKKNINLLEVYSTVIKEFNLKEDWVKEFIPPIKPEQLQTFNAKLPKDEKLSFAEKIIHYLWDDKDSAFRKTVLEYIGKMHDRDEVLFKRCDKLLKDLNENETKLNKVKQDVKTIHKDTENLNEKFSQLEKERESVLAQIETLRKEEYESSREKEKGFIENLKLIVNDKLFWKDKGVGINESQRKEPKSIGRYRRYLNNEKTF